MKIGFPVFSPLVEANYVRKQQYLSSAYKLTVEDKAEIRKLAEDNRIDKRVCYSANLGFSNICFQFIYEQLSCAVLNQICRL